MSLDRVVALSGEQYRSYPESLTMRQVSVDARDRDNRADRFKVGSRGHGSEDRSREPA